MSGEITNKILDIIHVNFPDLKLVYLFGSAANNKDQKESDVDLAFYAGAEVPPLRTFEVQQAIARKIHTAVDLIDLKAASTVMNYEVISTGKILYEAEPSFTNRYEERIDCLYRTLNEDRRGILEEIYQTGKVYAR